MLSRVITVNPNVEYHQIKKFVQDTVGKSKMARRQAVPIVVEFLVSALPSIHNQLKRRHILLAGQNMLLVVREGAWLEVLP